MKLLLPLIIIITLAVILGACSSPQIQAPPDEDKQTDSEIKLEQRCADYSRGLKTESHCATCGDNICDQYEKCISSSCSGGLCTQDCGQLFCPKDCGPEEQKPAPTEDLPEATLSLRICRRDDECVKVQADCCGCNYGGKAVSISKEFEENWEDTINAKCKDIICPTVLSNHWTCAAKPKCIQNKCTLEAATQPQQRYY